MQDQKNQMNKNLVSNQSACRKTSWNQNKQEKVSLRLIQAGAATRKLNLPRMKKYTTFNSHFLGK